MMKNNLKMIIPIILIVVPAISLACVNDIQSTIAENKIEKYSKKFDVDCTLSQAVAFAETGYDQNKRSDAGAIGMFQLMPSTAKYLDVDPYNIDGNIKGGIKYLSILIKRYEGDIVLALAAYNAGPSRVRQHDGVPPYKETKEFIQKVMKKYYKLKKRCE